MAAAFAAGGVDCVTKPIQPREVLARIMLGFKLTAREAEVSRWVARGKANRDIGDIRSTSRRTVTKHMAHILPKVGVETRTAAAGLVLGQLGRLGRLLGPGRV